MLAHKVPVCAVTAGISAAVLLLCTAGKGVQKKALVLQMLPQSLPHRMSHWSNLGQQGPSQVWPVRQEALSSSLSKEIQLTSPAALTLPNQAMQEVPP